MDLCVFKIKVYEQNPVLTIIRIKLKKKTVLQSRVRLIYDQNEFTRLLNKMFTIIVEPT